MYIKNKILKLSKVVQAFKDRESNFKKSFRPVPGGKVASLLLGFKNEDTFTRK